MALMEFFARGWRSSNSKPEQVMLQHCKNVHAMKEWNKRSCENHDTDVGVCCVRRAEGRGGSSSNGRFNY